VIVKIALVLGAECKSQELIKRISRANQDAGKVFRGGLCHPTK
jgi:hypothetical protein